MSAPIGEVNNPYEKPKTRWDELKQTISIVVDLASVLDPDGVDVYFLNREPMLNVRNSSELETVFAMEPEGATPIVPVLRQVLKEKRNHIYERKLLILIATDGIPTDERERSDPRTLEQVLKNERIPTNLIPVTIIVCTDDKECMKYLTDWDKNIPNLDVVSDYRTERNQVRSCHGKDFPFSFGDYIVKIIMGGIDSSFDDWNESKVTMSNQRPTNPSGYGSYASSNPKYPHS